MPNLDTNRMIDLAAPRSESSTPRGYDLFLHLIDDHARLRALIRLLALPPAQRMLPAEQLVATLAEEFRAYVAAKERTLYHVLSEREGCHGHLLDGRSRNRAIGIALEELGHGEPDSKPWQAMLQVVTRDLDAMIAIEEQARIPAAGRLLRDEDAVRLAAEYACVKTRTMVHDRT